MTKVCYFTSKPVHDVRIFEKISKTLFETGYEVYIVSPNAKDEIRNGVNIVGFPYYGSGLFSRIFVLPRLLYKTALNINADIYQFNDPASLIYASKLKRKCKKVIFDSIEDHPTLIFEKKSIPYFFQFIISKFYTVFEFYHCKNFDGIISCYHWTNSRLKKACENSELVFNFPIIQANVLQREEISGRTICYAGLFSRMWFIENILSALNEIEDISFNLAGNLADESYMNFLKNHYSWKKVNYLGQLDYKDVYDKVYSKSSIGMALLDYIPLCKYNIGNLSNNKLFEYMMAGLPVICTDFVLWKEVVEKNNCGICVNPHNNHEIVDAINFLLNNPETAIQMGKNGRDAIFREYNWSSQSIKLLSVYEKIK